MKIDSVHYSRKASDGHYGNAELGMHGQVQEGEDPVECAEYLQGLVTAALHEQARAADRRDQLEEQEHELAREIMRKEQQLKRMEGQWALARAFLEQHGVDVSRYTDVPF